MSHLLNTLRTTHENSCVALPNRCVPVTRILVFHIELSFMPSVTVNEMKKFLGLILLMGQVKKEHIKEHWFNKYHALKCY